MDAEHLRWFDYWLKGLGTGIPELAPARIFEPGRNAWREAAAWPLSNSVLTLYLAPESLLRGPPPVPSQDEYRYDPLEPATVDMDVRKYPFEDVSLEQTATERRDDVLVYTGEPLIEAVTVSGWATLELFASSDGEDTDWHVKLTDVTPEDRSFRVTQGCLRAACRDSLEEPAPLVPGKIYKFSVELWPTHHVFLRGHRIRVTVTSSDFPWFGRSLNRFGAPCELSDPRVALNRVNHGGDHKSCLVLPIETVLPIEAVLPIETV